MKIELAAHEPNVIDPVAIRFDEDGRMWIVEMLDYPTGSRTGAGGSRISVLDDADGDGFYETATVFAEDLPFATGLQPWRGGVFVTMAGEVAYLKDTDGDGRAEVRETWYRGFAQQNTQLRANHPRLALDNHIYIANGLRGGMIVDARRPDVRPVSISGRDFRFDPLTRECEAVSGVGQFGLAFDDYGNRFVCSNRNPAIHIVLEDRHIKKNPLFAGSAVSHDVAKAGDESRVFPITRSWTTSHLHAGQFTAACGLEVYRGDALPTNYYSNLFVCEPTGHLVHCEIAEPLGVTFSSRPAHDGVEFLASRDEWFSPVNLEVGPDGALYVVDMYRAVIEHPEWMPVELRARPDLLAGNDRGRIYRIVPQAFRRPAGPRLSSATSEQLVAHLAHSNAWWRETAARLLLERQNQSIAGKLREVALAHTSPLARIEAMHLLDGLDVLDDGSVEKALDAADPRVVEQAVVLSEPFVRENARLRARIAALRSHPDARVRFQALLVAEMPPKVPGFPADRWELDAMLIATGDRGGEVLAEMLRHVEKLAANVEEPKQFVAELARLAAASSDERQSRIALVALLQNREYARVGIRFLLAEAARSGDPIKELLPKLTAQKRDALDAAFQHAHREALDARRSDEARGEAIDLLSVAPDADAALTILALDDESQPIRLRAIAALARRSDSASWPQLLERFPAESPAVQGAILDGLFARRNRTAKLLDAVASGQMRATQLDTNRTTFLLHHRDADIQQRAQKLFADAIPTDREQALADYQAVLSMKADAGRGRGLFEKHCGTCHRVAGVGIAFAPDISDSREKTPEQLLTDIIQPNRAIDANYFSYTAVTLDGVVHTGILAAETSNSVTLKQAEGKAVTLRRAEIDELYSNGVSLMPDGLEQLLPPQDMADLIAFIKGWRYLDGNSSSK